MASPNSPRFTTRSSFGRRIFLLFALCVVAPSFVFGYFSIRQMGEELHKETMRRMRLQSRDISMVIHSSLSAIGNQLEFLTRVLPDGTFPNLPSSSDPDGLFIEGGLLGATRFREGSLAEPLYGTPCPPPPRTEAVRTHLASGKNLLYQQPDPGGPPRIFLARAIRGNAATRDLLACEVNLDFLWGRVRDATPALSEVAVLSQGGTPIFQTHPLPSALLGRVAQQRGEGPAGNFESGEGSEALIVDHAAVFLKPAFLSEDWTVVVSLPRSEGYAAAKQFKRGLLLSIGLVVLVAGLFALVQIRRNLAPLAVLKEATRRISMEDFHGRVEIDSGDEFEELSRSFNTMADRLGAEFRIQDDMGRIVQAILGETARDRIVKALLDNVPSVVPCDCVGLSLFDATAMEKGAITFFRKNAPTAPSETGRAILLFSAEEIGRLKSVETTLVAEQCGESGDIPSPWTESRLSAFLLSPVVADGDLQGVLQLGYRDPPTPTRETLIRLRQIADQVAIALNRARLLEELEENDLGTLQALARTVDTNSPWTAGHSERVTTLAMDIGRELGLPPREIDLLRRGALLHDIGKLGVSPSILDKPGKLTEEEHAIIKDHPLKGAKILDPIPSLQQVIPLVAQHHERFDGKGYPKGLHGKYIALHARILALADVVDALSSDRPYRPGWPREKVLAYARENAGPQFDPAVVEAFLRIASRRGEDAMPGPPESPRSEAPDASIRLDGASAILAT